MSNWGLGWFGGGQARKDAPKKAILGLREQLELLNKREKHLQHQVEEQDAIARKFVSTNKNAAKAALRRKKLFETSLEQTSAQLMNLESQIYSIETANINKETLEAMKNAAAATKVIHQGLDTDKVGKIMDELTEQRELAEDISNAIITGGQPIEDFELEQELADLEQEQLDESMLKTSVPVNKLPQAPQAEFKGKHRVEEEDEEDELKKLQAEMAI